MGKRLEPLNSAAQLANRFALLDVHIREMGKALRQEDAASELQRPCVIEAPPADFTDDELERF